MQGWLIWVEAGEVLGYVCEGVFWGRLVCEFEQTVWWNSALSSMTENMIQLVLAPREQEQAEDNGCASFQHWDTIPFLSSYFSSPSSQAMRTPGQAWASLFGSQTFGLN